MSLEEEKAQLELQRDIAKLRAEISSYSTPWWRSGATVAGLLTALTTIVSGAAAGVAAINGHYQVRKELELKQAEQEHDADLSSQKQSEEIRARYLDRMRDESERQRTLRFLVATAPDPKVAAWADKEKKIVDDEVANLKVSIAKLSSDLVVAKASASDALARKQAGYLGLKTRVLDLAAQKSALEVRLRSPTAPGMIEPSSWDPQQCRKNCGPQPLPSESAALTAWGTCIASCPNDI